MRVTVTGPCRPPLRCPSCASSTVADDKIVHADQCGLFADPPAPVDLPRPSVRKRQVRP